MTKMTKEAINKLKKYTLGRMNIEKVEINVITLNRIIEALEQEPILDKIIEEIMQLDYEIQDIDYDYNGMAQCETVHTICREEVIQIIEDYIYLEESEDKE